MPAKIVATQEQIRQVEELFGQGYGSRKISKILGITRDRVQNISKILGFYNVGRKSKNLSLFLTERACKICKITKEIAQFRKRIKNNTIKYLTMCKQCEREENFLRRKSAEIREAEQEAKNKLNDQIIALINDGIGTRQIAKILKISRSKVKTVVELFNIDISKRLHPKSPLPTEKICPKCPEVGIQPIKNFKPRKRQNGDIYFLYCHKCDKIRANERYSKNKHTPFYKIRSHISGMINFYLKKQHSDKNNQSCIEYLSYSITELIHHLESLFEPWMSWENRGKYNKNTWNDNDKSTWTWQIDHIIPQSILLYTSMEDENFKKCWALENLRPYSAKQNCIDGMRKMKKVGNNK